MVFKRGARQKEKELKCITGRRTYNTVKGSHMKMGEPNGTAHKVFYPSLNWFVLESQSVEPCREHESYKLWSSGWRLWVPLVRCPSCVQSDCQAFLLTRSCDAMYAL